MHITMLGCNQLSRLMAISATNLDIYVTFVAINGESTESVEGLGPVVHWSTQESSRALFQVIKKTDIITVVSEDIELNLLAELAMKKTIYPNMKALRIGYDRVIQKQWMEKFAVDNAPWLPVYSYEAIYHARRELGFPLVIKSAKGSESGKHQWTVTNESQLDEWVSRQTPGSFIVERLINFFSEVSLICVRGANGDIVFYPFTENHHNQGVLHKSIAPIAYLEPLWQIQAKEKLRNMLESIDFVGVMAAEYFVTENGLLMNEIVPRVHNSGHWTIDGSYTDQFENHLRAISLMPLGRTDAKGYSATLNIVGGLLTEPTKPAKPARLYWYNTENKPGQKLGHINLRVDNLHELNKKLTFIEHDLMPRVG